MDCGDHGCVFARNKTGMRTNGGCHCLPTDIPSAKRAEIKSAFAALHKQIDAREKAGDAMENYILGLCESANKDESCTECSKSYTQCPAWVVVNEWNKVKRRVGWYLDKAIGEESK